MTNVRAFVGIPLDERIRDGLVDVGRRVREVDPRWQSEKWVPAENLHITLKFIGSVPAEDIPALSDALDAALRTVQRFDMQLASIVAVPSRNRARMLWASFVDPTGSCGSLAAAAEAASLAFGAAPDERSFSPHATLVRARQPHAVGDQALAAANEGLSGLTEPVSVTRATLFGSELTPKGPIYHDLFSRDLGVD